jgi:hypothetical protein
MAENAEPEEVQAPDPQTFDLGTWLSGHQTYPRYSATVHVNGDAVKENNRLVDESRELRKELQELERSVGKTMNGSLVDPSAAERQHKIIARLKEIEAERAPVYAKAKASELTLHFRAKDPHVFKRVRARLKEIHPEVETMSAGRLQALFAEQPEVAQRQQALLLLELADEVVNADGARLDLSKLTVEAVELLLEGLSGPDAAKVYNNMNQAVSGAGALEEQIDAGFPG